MLRNISLHKRTNKIEISDDDLEFKELQRLFPSRRNWIELNQSERKSCNNSLKINQLRLYKSYIKTKENIEIGNIESPIWFNNLLKYIKDIQDEVFNIENSSYVISRPEIRGIKKKVKNKILICRPIALYKIKDKIICSITAKYFTLYFEHLFLDCSYAFRARNRTNQIPTHHHCIEEILKKRQSEKHLWVAECDIQKFFDTVQHEHLLKVFIELSNKIESQEGLVMDNRAKKIFKLFLSSFSFQKDILELNNNPDWFSSKGLINGQFDWVKDELNENFGQDYISKYKIGVPQGNAISCFISNLILHNVDEKVFNYQPDIFYVRYCDDMVLMHSEEEKCFNTLKKFMSELNKNFLLYHEPKKTKDYKEKENSLRFWKNKSKEPFYWGDKHVHEDNVPWVSFVGYQVDFYGKIRVRKDTLKKETKKQIATTQKLLKALGKLRNDHIIKSENSRWSINQIVSSLQQRLISMSVGRINVLNHKHPSEQGLCWTNGFKKLSRNKITSKQLKYLDRRRNFQLQRMPFELKSIRKGFKRRPKLKMSLINKSFKGGVFSYYNFLKYKKK
jgi:hypothetical protein